jgi:type I restriction enzyme S subunit
MPWLSIADMNQGRVLATTKECITDLALRERKCGRLVPANTVLLSFKLSVGKVGITKIPMFTNEAIAALPIRDKDRLDTHYLACALNALDLTKGLDRAAKGLTLNKEKLLELKIPLPPVTEQRRIAQVLDRAEALRRMRGAVIGQMESLAHALFVEMFGDPKSNPHRWPRLNLDDVLVEGPQNGLYKPASEYGSGTSILRIDAFYGGAVTKLDNLKRVRISPAEARQYGLRPGDLVVNRVNSMEYLGKSALIPALREPVVFESNMMRFAVDSERLEPRYVVQFLQTAFVKEQILKAAKHAVNQSSINQEDVKQFRINVPPLSLQREFARRVQAVERLKAAQRASLAELDSLFASLQHRAFRGEL